MLPFVALSIFFATLNGVSADPIDYVHPVYVSRTSYQKDPKTADAQRAIVFNADNSQNHGKTKSTISPPSGDRHDYLSWAPYHWPNCNWCGTSARKNSAHSHTRPRSSNNDSYYSDQDSSGLSDDGQDDDYSSSEMVEQQFLRRYSHPNSPRPHAHRMVRSRRTDTADVDTASSLTGNASSQQAEDEAQAPFVEQPSFTLPPTVTPSIPHNNPLISSPTPTQTVSGTSGHPQAAVKTKTTKHSCTPSPTKSMEPSATWTTCPYVTRDGKVNPDTRTLSGPGTLLNIPQDIFFNSVAFALTRRREYCDQAVQLLRVLLLDDETRINPNVNYGQVVRGPDQNTGTFTGILDFRALVKLVNGVQILKTSGCPSLTKDEDGVLQEWFREYDTWLGTSDLAKKASTRPNNHGTFFALQLAIVKMALGDYSAAQQVIKNFVDKILPDQIAQSGEQPFEAVRTRPYHYRCFNLEALITLFKLGDALGQNYWQAKSKHGATLQDAIDFAMKQNPGKERQAELVPHVAAAISAYGDPSGKYTAFLQQVDLNHEKRPFWYYDQHEALNYGPGSGKAKRDDVEDTVPFDCPGIFAEEGPSVEIEDGLFVTCAELEPFFELPASSTD